MRVYQMACGHRDEPRTRTGKLDTFADQRTCFRTIREEIESSGWLESWIALRWS